MDKIILITTSELEILIYNTLKKALSESKEIVPQNSKELFTIDEASQYLNLAKQTLYGLASKNKIPFIKRGKLFF